MIEKKCIGCGIDLQFEDINKLGYVPEEKLMTGGEIFCQRCFKIKNYGQNLRNDFTEEEYLKEVNKTLQKCDLVLPIFDIIDFEGSFTEEILDYLRDYPSIILVNKIDLLPDFVHPTEIANWIKMRLAEEDIVPNDIAFISAKNKYGINGIIRKIKYLFSDKKIKAGVFGVSNVGKSSVINLLLGKDKITTSKYSGTTLKSINNRIPNTNITIIDTPGLIPKGRMGDLFSSETGLKLVPSGEISRKTFKLENNQVFMFDIFCKMKVNVNDGESKPIFSVYSAKDVKFHITRDERVQHLVESDFFNVVEHKEREEFFKKKFITYNVEVNKDEDIAISGLGWINVKRGPLNVEITVPEGIKVIVRPSMFKGRK